MTLSIKTLFTAGAILLLPLHVFFAETPAETTPAEEGPRTEIFSERLEMTTLAEETRFIFFNDVKITTTDMTIFCDRLEVYAGRQDTAAKGSTSDLGRIRRIFAIGNVRIFQEDREATAGRAKVYPQEGYIELTENPILRDSQGSVSGHRIIFFQGEVGAIVEGAERQPVHVTLPTVPALGAEAEKRAKEDERSID